MAKENKTLKSQNWKYIIPYIGPTLSRVAAQFLE
jgi:hypothetical protein